MTEYASRKSHRLGKLGVLAVFLAVFAGLAIWVRHNFTIEQVAAQEERLRAVIASRPWTSFAMGLAFYSLVSLIPGTSGKSIVFGWLFGFWRGTLMVVVGLTIAAMTTFALSRYVLREAVESRFPSFLKMLNRALERDGPLYLLTLRMAHVPFSWINYCSGASRIDAWTFCWTTAVGLTPGTMVFVYVGTRLPTLHELAANGTGPLIDPPLVAALVLMAGFPLAMRWCQRWCVKWMRRRARGGEENAAEEHPPSS